MDHATSQVGLQQTGRPRQKAERRLEFIEFRLYWERKINRSDLTEYFGISIIQASKDLSKYQELAPENLVYDKNKKYYCATPQFEPKLIAPNSEYYLAQLLSIHSGASDKSDSFIGTFPDFDVLPAPVRLIDPNTLRTILNCINNKIDIEIYYQSMSRSEPVWRWIAPHVLSFDGLRWHMRAYCYLTECFKDFLLGRVLAVRDERAGTIDTTNDKAWQAYITVIIAPHPGLTENQKKIIELDYGMANGTREIRIKMDFLYYFLKRFGLGEDDTDRKANEQQIVLVNKDEIMAALKST